MRWRIRRIVNGCAAQQLVARRDVIAPEFISCCLVIRAINRNVCLKRVLTNRCSCPPMCVLDSRVGRCSGGFALVIRGGN